MLEKQHHQIPKQRSGRRAQQYPRADFAISRMVRFCLRLNKRFIINAAMAQKKKNRKSLPIIPHSPKNIASN